MSSPSCWLADKRVYNESKNPPRPFTLSTLPNMSAPHDKYSPPPAWRALLNLAHHLGKTTTDPKARRRHAGLYWRLFYAFKRRHAK